MKIFPVLLLVVASTCCIQAATVQSRLNPTTVKIGDTLGLDIQIQGAAGRPAGIPATEFTPFEVLRTDSTLLSSQGILHYTLGVYDTGQVTLKDLPVILGRGVAAETLRTAAQMVTVQPVAPDSAQSVRPLKPYRKHPLQWREVLGWSWIPGLLALAALGGWWWRKRMLQAKGESEPAVPLLPADEEAVRALIVLKDQKYPSRGMLKEFYSEFSQIMRRYLERRYEFPALEMTTFDLEYEFEEGRYPVVLRQRLLPLLREADLVKFAKYVPDYRECDAQVDLGFELITLTRPQLQLAEAEEKAA
jgi:hypothetical protein